MRFIILLSLFPCMAFGAKHISQKNANPYTVVICQKIINEGTEDETTVPCSADTDFNNHPSIVQHPERFQIIDEAIPSSHQNLIYNPD